MTIVKHTSKINSAMDKIKANIDSFTSFAQIEQYLDELESDILETSYGDMLYEFAWEYAQARLAEFDAASCT